ncbi:nucleolar MIF4G domain-containing protein 1 [Phascolarctos cinereus]|uniref:Nucleolar MIF4G domain-containing protein 1 n=1 Tax=Phascolarctos cinereus TaxID=38626 RepID=A0A6P5MAR1_PHACI|nr:nucleolar MIF4G domain-containing protein 1 [Phascolarctos cinereus]
MDGCLPLFFCPTGASQPQEDGGAQLHVVAAGCPEEEEAMKRKAGSGRHGGAMKRLRLAVQEFVHATAGDETPGGAEGTCHGGRPRAAPRPGGKKRRKELRKEKRHLRKARRLQRTGGPARAPGAAGERPGKKQKQAGAAAAAVLAPAPAVAPAPVPGKPQKPKQQQRPPPAEDRPLRGPTQAQARGPDAAAAAARKRALLEANEEEDREIRKLERRLGLSKRRQKKKGDGGRSSGCAKAALPSSFVRDGLDYILGALDAGGGSALYEEEDDEDGDGEGALLPRGGGLDGDSDKGDSGADSDEGDEEEEEAILEDDLQGEQDEEDEDEEEDEEQDGADTQVEAEKEKKKNRKRVHFADEDSEDASSEDESPTNEVLSKSAKYIPPHVRRSEETVDAKKKEELERLKKNVKGLINRLSEPNMASISGQLEELYMANSRKDMNDTLTDVLMNACVTEAVMPARLMMEHVLLVSILHHTVGIEVGAHFLEAVVKKFDEIHKTGSEGKECDNLFAIIAHLYNFRVVQSLLIFDILKKLIGTFTEKDIELILLMLKNVGFSLRKDDALSLKDLITEAQTKANGIGKKFQDQTRIRFMLETMLALKNNDMRKIPGYDPEPVEKLRKLQRTLIRNSGSGKETQLRVSWESLLNAEQIGRWWIVGSSWSGAPMIDCNSYNQQKQLKGTVSSKILELARKQRMNTDIRRNIFCTLMISEDFLDAFEKLLKLGLRDQQEREIVHVLIDCCLQEKIYNPFYAYLASKFCEYERRFQMTFQFSIWDKFRDLENLSATAFSNFVQLVAHLLKKKSLPLSIFKVVEFSELNKPRVHFLRKILHKLLMETEVEELATIFGRVSDNPKLGMLREGLKLFISHFLLRNAQALQSAEEANTLKERADLATKSLQGKSSLKM